MHPLQISWRRGTNREVIDRRFSLDGRSPSLIDDLNSVNIHAMSSQWTHFDSIIRTLSGLVLSQHSACTVSLHKANSDSNPGDIYFKNDDCTLLLCYNREIEDFLIGDRKKILPIKMEAEMNSEDSDAEG